MGVGVSVKTGRCVLHETGLSAADNEIHPELLPANFKTRLEFARDQMIRRLTTGHVLAQMDVSRSMRGKVGKLDMSSRLSNTEAAQS